MQPGIAQAVTTDETQSQWLSAFHAGDREVLESCYYEHFDTVERATGRILSGADQETAVQELFLQLVSNADFRRKFQGGSLGAWLATVARNRAIDVLRRQGREQPHSSAVHDRSVDFESSAHARLTIDKFRREVLPAKWCPVFEARFLRQLSQSEAATELQMGRTTLAYQEQRIRWLLKKFLLRTDET
jgi:RNA polymerase sigma-70 factor, ECF subfamily